VRADGDGEEARFDGVVWRIYPRAFTKLSSLGVEQQRVKVIVRFSEQATASLQEYGIGVDYRVRVRIFVRKSRGTLVVPRSALFRSIDGGWQVYVVRNGVVELQDVRVGLMNDERGEIVEGVQEDECVVLAPDNTVTDGVRVTITP
jgi:HlyD family secretion protein